MNLESIIQIEVNQKEKNKYCILTHWKDWCWSWTSNILATWWEELTHLKRPWCWERLKVGGEGDDRGWDRWMASPTQWTWVWVDSGSWWWTGRPGALWFMGSQRVGHDWVTEMNNKKLLTCIEHLAMCLAHVIYIFNSQNYYLYFIGMKDEAQRGIACLRFQGSKRWLRDSNPSILTPETRFLSTMSCCLLKLLTWRYG